jgi:hypothetical protein
MNTLKTIPTPDIRSKFEEAARVAGHRNFTRRGDLYCVSDLNTLAEGFCMGLAGATPSRIAPCRGAA